MSGQTNEAFEIDNKLGSTSSTIPANGKVQETELLTVEHGGTIEQNDKDKCRPRQVGRTRSRLGPLGRGNSDRFATLLILILNACIFVYFGFATDYWLRTHWPNRDFQWCDGYGMLVILMAGTYGLLFYFKIVKVYLAKSILASLRPVGRCLKRLHDVEWVSKFSKPLFYVVVLGIIVAFMVWDTAESRGRLISVIGVVVIMGFGWIFSKHPTNVNWTPVLSGLILQFMFGLFTIRWSVGRAIFQCIADKVTVFLNYSQEGAIFVYSDELVTTIGVFAFASLSVVFFFSVIIQILYYLGAMQWVVLKLGWLLKITMGTTVCESVISVANTFLSMTESPLLIKPCIPSLTTSEIHAVMTSGFATVSGTVLAAYIRYGAEPAHLITASVMSAPAALCYAKLFYPETEESQTTFENIQIEKSKDKSILDAAANGALAGLPIVLGIIANVIAFVSLVAFFNGITAWLGILLGYEGISLEWFLSKVFMPLSWIMGVPWDECEMVGGLIGLKTMVNEFAAYQKLGEYKEANMLTPRSEAIATYAICGFANPGSVGIMIGSLASIAPGKRDEIAGVAARSFVAGSAVCFLTACIAGMLMTDDFFTNVSSS